MQSCVMMKVKCSWFTFNGGIIFGSFSFLGFFLLIQFLLIWCQEHLSVSAPCHRSWHILPFCRRWFVSFSFLWQFELETTLLQFMITFVRLYGFSLFCLRVNWLCLCGLFADRPERLDYFEDRSDFVGGRPAACLFHHR